MTRPVLRDLSLRLAGCFLFFVLTFRSSGVEPGVPVTFHKDVAAIVYRRCSPCHHAGQPAPFSLVSFADAKKHAKDILEATETRYMPPWLPEPGYGEFSNSRRLTNGEMDLIRRWVSGGALEGDAKDSPKVPEWVDGWVQGKPDMVVTMEKPYLLEAEGADVYRNFVVKIPITRDRYVRALEFGPGNSKIVHHAFVRVDEAGNSSGMDGRDGKPGFDGFASNAKMPGGQFLTWQPGKLPVTMAEELAWKLTRGSELIVQLHMNRTGKPETIQSSVALYFTDKVPTNTCFKFKLTSFALDFPAGSTNNVIKDSFTLPIAADVLGVMPHAHFLAKDMKGFAVLPDGRTNWLLWIKQWDFRWQGDYQFSKPLHFPAGTKFCMEYSYDNSTNNVFNPNHPPKPVKYGPQTGDEMGEFWVQLLPEKSADVASLEKAVRAHLGKVTMEGYEDRIAKDPGDYETMNNLGLLLFTQNRGVEGGRLIDKALALNPKFAEAHFNKGVLLRLGGKAGEAVGEFETALALNPNHAKAYGQLGFALAEKGLAVRAESSFLKSLELNPADMEIRGALAELQQWMSDHPPQ